MGEGFVPTSDPACCRQAQRGDAEASLEYLALNESRERWHGDLARAQV